MDKKLGKFFTTLFHMTINSSKVTSVKIIVDIMEHQYII
jgi:hypothetical protein